MKWLAITAIRFLLFQFKTWRILSAIIAVRFLLFQFKTSVLWDLWTSGFPCSRSRVITRWGDCTSWTPSWRMWAVPLQRRFTPRPATSSAEFLKRLDIAFKIVQHNLTVLVEASPVLHHSNLIICQFSKVVFWVYSKWQCRSLQSAKAGVGLGQHNIVRYILDSVQLLCWVTSRAPSAEWTLKVVTSLFMCGCWYSFVLYVVH